MRVATSLALLLLCTPAPAAARELIVPPASLAPVAAGAAYAIDQGGLGCLRLNKGSAFFVAAVPAATGEAIEEVTLLVEDVNADALAMLTLARRRATAFEVVGMTPPSRGGGALEALTLRPDPPAIVGEGESYLLQIVVTGPQVCVHGVRVHLAQGSR